ncbi:hypothetical protein B0J17DRAFT_719180 [Rhizoctonia solani]|nr:hypothetical protein B0J17DRAFT_719180 [Rhizoctonia solani]
MKNVFALLASFVLLAPAVLAAPVALPGGGGEGGHGNLCLSSGHHGDDDHGHSGKEICIGGEIGIGHGGGHGKGDD